MGSLHAALAKAYTGCARRGRPCEDFRFPLMRQWSVREALLHSRYVAVRLQTWQDKGRRLVDELLSNMGLPLAHCKRDFCAAPAPAPPCAPWARGLPGDNKEWCAWGSVARPAARTWHFPHVPEESASSQAAWPAVLNGRHESQVCRGLG